MDEEVHLCKPRRQTGMDEARKRSSCVSLACIRQQRVPDVRQIVHTTQRSYPRIQHQRQQVQEQVGMTTYQVESFTTKVDKVLEPTAWLIATVDDVSHVGGQNKGSPVTTKCTKHLRMPENLGKIDVEKMAALSDHDVIVVSVTDPQNVRSNAVTCARGCEVVDR